MEERAATGRFQRNDAGQRAAIARFAGSVEYYKRLRDKRRRKSEAESSSVRSADYGSLNMKDILKARKTKSEPEDQVVRGVFFLLCSCMKELFELKVRWYAALFNLQ